MSTPTTHIMWVTDCPHHKFELRHIKDHGWVGICHACDVKGREHPLAHTAIESFEKKVKECRKVEKKDGQPAPRERRTG